MAGVPGSLSQGHCEVWKNEPHVWKPQRCVDAHSVSASVDTMMTCPNSKLCLEHPVRWQWITCVLDHSALPRASTFTAESYAWPRRRFAITYGTPDILHSSCFFKYVTPIPIPFLQRRVIGHSLPQDSQTSEVLCKAKFAHIWRSDSLSTWRFFHTSAVTHR